MSEYKPNPFVIRYRKFLSQEGQNINPLEIARALRKDQIISLEQEEQCRAATSWDGQRNVLFFDVLAPMGKVGAQHLADQLRKLHLKNWSLYASTADRLEKVMAMDPSLITVTGHPAPNGPASEQTSENAVPILVQETSSIAISQQAIGHNVNMGDLGKIVNLAKFGKGPTATDQETSEASLNQDMVSNNVSESITSSAGFSLSIGNQFVGGANGSTSVSAGISADSGVKINIGSTIGQEKSGTDQSSNGLGDVAIQQTEIRHQINLEHALGPDETMAHTEPLTSGAASVVQLPGQQGYIVPGPPKRHFPQDPTWALRFLNIFMMIVAGLLLIFGITATSLGIYDDTDTYGSICSINEIDGTGICAGLLALVTSLIGFCEFRATRRNRCRAGTYQVLTIVSASVIWISVVSAFTWAGLIDQFGSNCHDFYHTTPKLDATYKSFVTIDIILGLFGVFYTVLAIINSVLMCRWINNCCCPPNQIAVMPQSQPIYYHPNQYHSPHQGIGYPGQGPPQAHQQGIPYNQTESQSHTGRGAAPVQQLNNQPYQRQGQPPQGIPINQIQNQAYPAEVPPQAQSIENGAYPTQVYASTT